MLSDVVVKLVLRVDVLVVLVVLRIAVRYPDELVVLLLVVSEMLTVLVFMLVLTLVAEP